MNNVFKGNSRFSNLMDNNNNNNLSSIKKPPIEMDKREQKSNAFKNNRDRRSNRQLSDRELQQLRDEYKADDEIKQRLKQEEIERQNTESLKIDNFPELFVSNNKQHKASYDESYIEKLNSICEVESSINIDSDLEKMDEGWIMLKKDMITGKTITKSKPKYNSILKNNNIKINNEIITTQLTFNKLSELHETRTQEYIELHDYDTWESMFKCKDWREWEAKYEVDSDDEDEDDDDEDEDEMEEYE